MKVCFSKCFNAGCAFGLLSGQARFLLFWRLLGLFLFAILFKHSSGCYRKLLALFAWTGAMGNFLDSLRYGGVLDFWEISFGPFALSFNFSDLLLSLSCGVLLVQSFLKRKITSSERND
ncbi:signal peptidase II [Candidatus Similichlamydia laticola]|uniref:Uncharacterized protein n=1 Tax=Candidatus Similichlamydia laticola TaxID=2170265 RepID=A0A369K9Q3_9BACT|nr:signal peptidase II [Candidatus Similichlamydia laticola]RDB31321.1 hypothetical protein HAT2_00577 [Candidatus Similichlamydia laticola]